MPPKKGKGGGAAKSDKNAAKGGKGGRIYSFKVLINCPLNTYRVNIANKLSCN